MKSKPKLLYIPRCGWRLNMETKGGVIFNDLIPDLSDDFEIMCVSSAVDKREKNEFFTIVPWQFQYNFGGDFIDYLKGVLSLFKIVRKEDPDLIIAGHPTMLGLMAVITGLLSGKKIVLGEGGKIDESKKSDILMNITTFFSHKILVVSEYLKDEIRGYTSEEKIEVIYPGINYPDKKPEKYTHSDKKKIGYLGRFQRVKGIDRFIRLVKKQPKNVEFFVAGWGDYKIKEIKKLDKKGSLNFLGKLPHEDVFDYLASLDFLVVPSRSEGFGRINIESLSMGTPIIGWDLPVFREILEDEALLVNDEEELYEKVQNLNPDEIDLDWFDPDKYTVENEARRLKEIFKELISN